MNTSLESILSESSTRNIYLKIKQKSEALGLPCNAHEQLVGFGKFTDFYMYWICYKNGEPLFSARLNYVKNKEKNIIRLILADENTDKIFDSIENIYKSYMDYKTSGTILQPKNEENAAIAENLYSDETDILEKELKRVMTQLSECVNNNGDACLGHISDTRVRNIFAQHNITTYEDILNYSAHQISQWKNCGKKCLELIINLIRQYLSSNGIDTTNENSATVLPSIDKVRLQKITSETTWFKLNASSDEIELFDHTALTIEQLSKQALTQLCEFSKNNKRYFLIWSEYVRNDLSTLQAIGNKYGISRERVRQIVKKQSLKFKRAFLKNIKFLDYSQKILQAFNSIDDESFVYFVAYYLIDRLGLRLTKFILSCFYDKCELLLDCANTLLLKKVTLQKNEKRNSEKEIHLLEQICYPSDHGCNIVIDNISIKSDKMQFQYKINVANKLSQFPTIKHVITNPNLVYSISSRTEHTPDFLIETENGSFALIVVVNTINMAFYYNVKRFNDLHLYCKKNGFGYVIMNERFKSIFEIKKCVLDENLVNELNYILEKTHSIVWKDIVLLRTRYTITEEAIVAYVLQNKLDFHLKPFMICSRTND